MDNLSLWIGMAAMTLATLVFSALFGVAVRRRVRGWRLFLVLYGLAVTLMAIGAIMGGSLVFFILMSILVLPIAVLPYQSTLHFYRSLDHAAEQRGKR